MTISKPIPIANGRWTAGVVGMGSEILDRMERAVVKVRERLLRATTALNQVGVPYAVVGGNAVASWVATIDEGAVRNSLGVDLLINRSDVPAVTMALQQAGFVFEHLLNDILFLDGVEGTSREAVRLLFSGERIRPDHLLPAPQVEAVDDPAHFKVLQLESLVEMLVNQNRSEDGMYVRDLVDVGLIDHTWPVRFPPELAARLQHLLDTPDG